MNLETIKTECEKLANSGALDEDLLKFLRNQNCSKTASVFVISQVKGIDMAGAKKMVHFSKTWADKKDSDEKWHQELDQKMKPK